MRRFAGKRKYKNPIQKGIVYSISTVSVAAIIPMRYGPNR